jgi:hypothetical protein
MVSDGARLGMAGRSLVKAMWAILEARRTLPGASRLVHERHQKSHTGADTEAARTLAQADRIANLCRTFSGVQQYPTPYLAFEERVVLIQDPPPWAPHRSRSWHVMGNVRVHCRRQQFLRTMGRLAHEEGSAQGAGQRLMMKRAAEPQGLARVDIRQYFKWARSLKDEAVMRCLIQVWASRLPSVRPDINGEQPHGWRCSLCGMTAQLPAHTWTCTAPIAMDTRRMTAPVSRARPGPK